MVEEKTVHLIPIHLPPTVLLETYGFPPPEIPEMLPGIQMYLNSS
jgi:hypothetical protein